MQRKLALLGGGEGQFIHVGTLSPPCLRIMGTCAEDVMVELILPEGQTELARCNVGDAEYHILPRAEWVRVSTVEHQDVVCYLIQRDEGLHAVCSVRS